MMAIVATVALVFVASWIYLRRELPVPRRGLLLALRSVALSLLAVLFFQPELRLPGRGGDTRWNVVDASPSMAFGAPGGTAPVDALARHLATSDASDPAVRFGDDPSAGGGAASALAPALRRAAESGARSVTVYTDLRVPDGTEALVEAGRLGLGVEVVDLGGPLVSAGIARLDAPSTGRAGDPVTVEVELFATAEAAGGEAVLTLERIGSEGEATPLAVDTVRLAPAGGTVAVETATLLPAEPGEVVWRATVALPGDGVPADDTRHTVTRVDPLSGIVALMSLRPDWEPRWLLPVLAEATGLPTRGWLRVGEDRWLSMGDGGLLSGDSVGRVLREARVAVVHGVGADDPPWVEAVLGQAPRLLVLPGPGGDAAGAVGFSGGAPQSGEWYPDPDAPGPFNALLGGLELAALPPLTGVVPLEDSDGGATTGLTLSRPGGGQGAAILLSDASGERRVAVAGARGFWRWAARGGDPREAHRRLFSGVVGWLLAEGPDPATAAVGPDPAVVSSGVELSWRLPPGVRVERRVTGAQGVVWGDTVQVGSDGRARGPAPPQGPHRWQVTVLPGDGVAAGGEDPPAGPGDDAADGTGGPTEATGGPAPGDTWSGVVVGERWTDEVRWPRDTLLRAGIPAPAVARDPSGPPLRSTPWPWLLVMGLLCGEWILRRRWGLR